MLRYAIALLLIGTASAHADDPRGLFPANTRLVAVWNRPGMLETPAKRAFQRVHATLAKL